LSLVERGEVSKLVLALFASSIPSSRKADSYVISSLATPGSCELGTLRYLPSLGILTILAPFDLSSALRKTRRGRCVFYFYEIHLTEIAQNIFFQDASSL